MYPNQDEIFERLETTRAWPALGLPGELERSRRAAQRQGHRVGQ